jgi:hypothetical protein
VWDRQIEGLTRFAEELEWPYLSETKDFATTKELDIIVRDNTYIWDWLYGLTLPGSNFSHNIIIALVFASQSTRSLWLAPSPSFGLALEDRSYWRQSSVMGRVLAGLKDVKAISGWLGPCPASRNPPVRGWASIQAPIREFPRSRYRVDKFRAGSGDL